MQDSIVYAKRIQNSILPNEKFIKKLFPKSLLFYSPKDVVSGDFYWASENNGIHYFAAVDCTGHGVPGAIMSIVGYNALYTSLVEHQELLPNKVLSEINEFTYRSLNDQYSDEEVKDGMDMALISYEPATKKLQFSGAMNPMYLLRGDEVEVIKGDKRPIGSYNENENEYKMHEFQLKTNDRVYVFSDGYPDQFGGERGKKFMYGKFRKMFNETSHLSMKEQQSHIVKVFNDWLGSKYQQIDDVLVFGFEV